MENRPFGIKKANAYAIKQTSDTKAAILLNTALSQTNCCAEIAHTYISLSFGRSQESNFHARFLSRLRPIFLFVKK